MDSDRLNSIAAGLGGRAVIERRTAAIEVPAQTLGEACRMVSLIPGFYHLSTVTGVDDGDSIEVQYHFWKGTEFVSVIVHVPKTEPTLQSVCGEIPAAIMYEAEVHDMLGVNFRGNPLAGRKLLLPDNYPKDAPPPLRKEANPEEIRKMMGLE